MTHSGLCLPKLTLWPWAVVMATMTKWKSLECPLLIKTVDQKQYPISRKTADSCRHWRFEKIYTQMVTPVPAAVSDVSSLLEWSDQSSDAWYEASGRANAFISTPIWKEHITSLAFTWQDNQYNSTVLHQGCQFCSRVLISGIKECGWLFSLWCPFTEFLFTKKLGALWVWMS